ncbi:peptide-binding protein [Streptomyces ipomoeae]|uniref:Peptide-binding protein n=1 Tax=Streptomyces ipomoeae TaxID=103232 RepID=A0AAE9AVZ2_9ACTN|nr:ABC transporter substrate-binding protein [Streptomyces ipomoeae]MDX2700624.1 ABC transporter substrate-binding protein [Streptomyces ipomoeae]MDX2828312.1 ABC transporter substrate-binding protein [Streptomyces ipomoeae]MDX2846285.1 ABC transporter substrate-binding protein [Streptomyces ipomoeae]MDX2880791.1 ABC transporter substrate-binding protein [Streptomyces ipomoeae]TQE16631.1 peptide-binding protein [Streptomyces ipomoeae]
MRSVRLRILVSLLVLAIAAVGGWQLMPAQRDKNRTITVGTTDTITSLDPAGAYDAGSWALFSNVFQSLLTFEPGNTAPVPDAARSCEFVGNALTVYRCTLREGLKFPSGREVTGADVKYSFDRVKRINSDVGPASLLDTLQSVGVSGLTVSFRLSGPDATFPFKLATGAGSIVDRTKYPSNRLRTDGGADGTGPYTLTSYTKDQQARLRPNDDYQGAVHQAGSPVLMRYYKDSAALEKAWKARRVDVATRTLPPAVLAGLSPSDPDQRVTEADSTETRNLVLNVRAGSPFHDRRVRQALASLINREKLVADVYHGTTDPLYSLIPAGITGHTTSFFDMYPEPDPQRARRLLEAAGVKLPVRFTYGYGAGRESAAAEATELKAQLESTGLFQVTTKAYEWTDFQRRYAEGKLDAYAVGWVADYPDPDTFSGPLVGTDGSMKNGYSSQEADRLVQDSRRYADRGMTTRDFQDLQEVVAQDVPLIPLWQRKEYVLSTEDVGGAQYLSDGTGVFRLWRLEWI